VSIPLVSQYRQFTHRRLYLVNCVAVVAFTSGIVASRTDASASERSEAFRGCYRLELGRWTRFWIFPAQVARYQVPPSTFHLDDNPVDSLDPDHFRVKPNTMIADKPSRLDGWSLGPNGSRSVVITWTDGFTGVTLRLESDGAKLRGHATAYTDAPSLLPFPTAPAVAERITCETVRESSK
jgi:hypothetical protein